MKKSSKSLTIEIITIIAIMAAIFTIRLYHIDTAPVEIEESWRQGDTESIARNFAEYRFNILYPNFNYDGPLPNVPALEFQVTTFIIAILYKIFGYRYLWARLVPICFFMMSSLLLYLFARKYLGKAGAAFTLIVYGIIPINIYYSRAIMPEAAGLMFFIGGLYFFDLWFSAKRLHYFALSSIFTVLALMTKPVTAFVGLPMLFICFRETGWRWFTQAELWAFAAVVLGLTFAYYSFSISVAEHKFALGLAQNVLIKRLPTAIADPDAYIFILKKTLKMLTPSGVLFALLGLLSLKRNHLVILVWFGAMALELMLVVSVIKVYYYLIFFAVPCCILIGRGLERIYRFQKVRVLALAALCYLIVSSLAAVRPSYRINTVMQTQIGIVEQVTQKDDLLVAGSVDPCILSISGRRGWRFNISDKLYRTTYEELNYYIRNGAKYFIPIQGRIYRDEEGKILEYLNSNYEKIEVVKGYPVFKLR